jgi:DNA-directed RNA polymerase II subunit RPB2
MTTNVELPWDIIDKYFRDNPYSLVDHHLDSFNNFYKTGLRTILLEKNPIKILKNQNEKTNEFMLQCDLFLGGKKGDKIYFGKPIIYDDQNIHYMYPNEARLRNMTYGFSIHYDVDVEFKIINDVGEIINQEITLEQIYLGKFPIMLQSNLCVLAGLNSEIRSIAGECKSDPGGYFIIDGKEKVIICQEKFADNMLYIRDKVDDIYSYSAEVKSRSEDASKPVRTTSVKIIAPTSLYTNNQIVVIIPNVKKPIPLFIVMRALGVLSDKKIIERCILDLNKYESYMELFIPSIHDAHRIYSQRNALNYIKEFTKEKTVFKVLDILSNLFLPHIGELDFEQKSYYLGFMVMKMLKVSTKEENPTDRDNFKYKRIEVTGTLLYDLFKEYYTILQQNVYKKIDKEYYYHKGQYQDGKFINLIQNNWHEFFKDRDVETGFKKAFKGNWGAQEHTKKEGIVQDLNRLSFNSALSQRRKLNLPLDASAKVVGPRLLHGSQWGYIDPVDTPDGGNVGLHKHLAISTKITTSTSIAPIIKWLRLHANIKFLTETSELYISKNTKIIVNGVWVGIVFDPVKLIELFKFHRRIACIPVYISISWAIDENIIYIYSDAGRLIRPIFYINKNRILSIKQNNIEQRIIDNDFTWNNLIYGFTNKNLDIYDNNTFYEVDVLYKNVSNEILINNQAVIDYIDVSEESTSLITVEEKDYTNNFYTHQEIHPSLILGVMGQQIIYPANNQLPRDLFSCGQSKQAVSLYASNFDVRIDKMSVILNYGQIPLVKSRYLEYINQEKNPYGENLIVAIGVYGGYNVEDSILFNKGSIDRGMFRTTYFNSYESREESTKVSSSLIDSKFCNIEQQINVVGLKPGYDYSYLDEHGIIKENTPLNEKVVVIGKTTTDINDPTHSIDASTSVKKGQLGFVDKTFITEGEEGFRLAKVRIRDERIPSIGDKFCSRCGQKGTVGLIIPEESMPFTSDGLKPDIIVNPHAFPSRMTIGQFVESLSGKAACAIGAFGDTTAFVNKGSKHDLFGKLLTQVGYNKSGNQILYNGQTGEQINTEIYIGPTYYMRLKHMVKDKINYRARGPRTVLTRQTVQGRANDGGLRVGEMERDSLIAHGISGFLNESMLIRGDEYYIAVCNKSGMLAIFNESRNLFLSPHIDGPIRFVNQIPPFKCGEIEDISKYGREFSILRVPYAFKLLIQELGTMNIALRLITQDNIDQLTTMSYSDNASKLLFQSNTEERSMFKMIERDIVKQQINEKEEVKDTSPDDLLNVYNPEKPTLSNEIIYQTSNVSNTQQLSPNYAPDSPPLDDSPPFDTRQLSPNYAPDSPPLDDSPPFDTRQLSPNYAPDSPPFDTRQLSPNYAPDSPPLDDSPPYVLLDNTSNIQQNNPVESTTKIVEVKEPEPELKEPEPELKEPEPELKEPEVKEPELEIKEPELELKEPESEKSLLKDIDDNNTPETETNTTSDNEDKKTISIKLNNI